MTVKAHEAKPVEECERFPEKKRFDLRGDALEAVSNALARDGLHLYYFACRHCNGFHLSKEQR